MPLYLNAATSHVVDGTRCVRDRPGVAAGATSVTPHQRPHWFLRLSGPCPEKQNPSSPLFFPQNFYRSFSCKARPGVYFHGWGVKTALSLFWLAAPFPEETEEGRRLSGVHVCRWDEQKTGGGKGPEWWPLWSASDRV